MSFLIPKRQRWGTPPLVDPAPLILLAQDQNAMTGLLLQHPPTGARGALGLKGTIVAGSRGDGEGEGSAIRSEKIGHIHKYTHTHKETENMLTMLRERTPHHSLFKLLLSEHSACSFPFPPFNQFFYLATKKS